MNFTLLSDPLPKPWCNINCQSLTAKTMSADEIDINDMKVSDINFTTARQSDTPLSATNYALPTTAGITGQVLTKGMGVSSAWQTPQVYGLFSQTSIKTVENTLAETSLIGTGVGGRTVPIGFFQNGYSFVYKTGGQWRTVANSQSIRFRLRTNSFLFDTGILLTTNVNTVRGWNVECQFTYYAGSIVTNFTFTYIDANNNTSGFVSRGNGVIDNTVSNTIDFTVQWGGAVSISNTITSDYGTLIKIF